MFTKTTFALIIIAGTASGALAATKHQSVAPPCCSQSRRVRHARQVYWYRSELHSAL